MFLNSNLTTTHNNSLKALMQNARQKNYCSVLGLIQKSNGRTCEDIANEHDGVSIRFWKKYNEIHHDTGTSLIIIHNTYTK